MVLRKDRIAEPDIFTVCDDCGTHGEWLTRKEANSQMDDHYGNTQHANQRYSTPTTNGWRTFAPVPL